MNFSEDSLLVVSLLAVFLIAYPISMLEYGYRKFPNNYFLLFKVSLPFHVFGLSHGILGAVIYWVLWQKGMLSEGEVASFLNPICIGLGIKGITNLNFYSLVSNPKEKENQAGVTPIGPKLIMDSIEMYCQSFVEDSHDRYLDFYIQKSIQTHLIHLPTDIIISELIKYLPHSTKAIIRNAFKQEVEKSVKENGDDLYFAMRLFVSQYGLSRFKRFIYRIELKGLLE